MNKYSKESKHIKFDKQHYSTKPITINFELFLINMQEEMLTLIKRNPMDEKWKWM